MLMGEGAYVVRVMWEIDEESERGRRKKQGWVGMMICGKDLTVTAPPYMLCDDLTPSLLSSVSLSSPSLLPHLYILSINSSPMS